MIQQAKMTNTKYLESEREGNYPDLNRLILNKLDSIPEYKKPEKKEVILGDIVKRSKSHVWYNSNVGVIRKPL